MKKAYFCENDQLLSAFERKNCRVASSFDIPCGDWINEEGEEFDGRKVEFLAQFFPEGISLADGDWNIEKNSAVVRGAIKDWYLLKR